MRKRLRTLSSALLVWILVLQFVVGSTLNVLPRAYAGTDDAGASDGSQESTLVDQIAAAGAKDPLTIQGRGEAEAFASEVESSREDGLPTRLSDTFHLTGQRLEILSGPLTGEYDLSTLNVEVPAVTANFDRAVSVEVNREAHELALVYSKKGAPYAKHVISNVDVVSYSADTEMLQFIDANGKMFAMDMVFARGAAFKMPLPIFEVGALPEGALAKGELQTAFIARGVRPAEAIPQDAVLPLDVEQKDVWSAGDFMVYFDNAEGKRELVGLYKRGVTQMQVYTGTAVVSFLATLVSPPDERSVMGAATAPLADPIVGAETSEAAGALDPLTREALSAFDKDSLNLLKARAAANKALAASPRDRLAFDEWVKEHETLRARAQAELDNLDPKQMLRDGGKRYEQLRTMLERDDFSPEWQKVVKEALGSNAQKRGLIYRFMTSKAMKALAAVTGGFFAVKGVGYLKDLPIGPETSRPLAWAISAAGWLYEHVWPGVLKDAAYRTTLFKSWFTLGSFVPAMQVVGILYGGAKGWGPNKAKAAMGIRAYSIFVLPFWIHLARLVRQPNLMPALRMGLNPFAKVTKDSALGKAVGLTRDVRPGLVTAGDDREEDARIKREVIKAVATQKARMKAYAYLLADIAVGEKFGIDPVTMMLARGNKLPDDADAASLLNNPEFVKQWLTLARELAVTLTDMKQGALLGDVSQVPAGEIAADFRAAKELAAKISSRGRLASLLSTLKVRWREFGAKFAKGAGTYGVREQEFLKNVEPSDTVVQATWQQFFIDYALTTIQMGLFGDRANFAKPDLLAAKENGILFTNSAHFADMLDGVIRSYGMENPAGLALVFQKDPALVESRYAPIENLTMVGTPRMDTFAHGLLVWTKGVLSLRKADYGGLFLKSLKKKFRTMQASFVLSMTARLALAGQSLTQALTGYSYLFVYGMPASGWPWMPITQGNETYEETMKAADAEFMAAKAKLAQGLRIGDDALISQGYDELSGVFAEHGKGELPKELYDGLKAAEEFLRIPEAERLSEQEKLDNFYGQAARLKAALEKGEATGIAETYEQVLSQYKGEVSAEMRALNGRALLEVALKAPPFRNKAHPYVTWTATIIGSVVTTLWATAVLAASYSHGITLAAFRQAFIVSIGFYSGSYFGQKLINKLASRIDYILEHDERAKALARGEKTAAPPPVPATFEEFRRGYIEARAAAFKVDTKEVEAVMDKNVDEVLRRRYQILLTQSACEPLLTDAEAIKPLTLGQKLGVLARGAPKKKN